MQKIFTMDGSVTFHSDIFDEAYHSKSGAKEEALKKFAEQCNIKELAKTGSIRILDICFGLGYNTAAALDVALGENPNCSIQITGLENDETILNEILFLDNPFNYYEIIKETIKNKNKKIYVYNKNNIKIEILLGDARETIKTLVHKSHHKHDEKYDEKYDKKYDAVFLDPFSPKKCPELWTAEFFSDIAALIKQDRRLATYSCARIVRDNLKGAGFSVFDGPKLWRRGPSTTAII